MSDVTVTSSPAHDAFVRRHVGSLARQDEQRRMLAAVGVSSIDDLLERAIPQGVRSSTGLRLDAPATEAQAAAELHAIAGRNRALPSMIGLGYYGTETPAVIRRNVLENPSWYTAYTPYQPEISQGRLEALLNFQTMVSDLTALDVANASMLDEATAVVEAMLLARRASRAKTSVFAVDADLLPQTRAVLANRAEAAHIELAEFRLDDEGEPIGLPSAFFGVVVQYPGASGRVADPSTVFERAHDAGALAICAADLLALALITPPGELGADIAAGTTQRFGVPMGFGGPHAGYLAVRSKLQRQLPGRLVGVSHDADGQPAYRLALQTREQHIRRERATSNICTAQVLLAVMASMYAVYHGPDGLRAIAARVAGRAAAFAGRLRAAGIAVEHARFFDTVRACVPGRADKVVAAALERGVNVWRADADTVQVAFDETTSHESEAAALAAFGVEAGGPSHHAPGGVRDASATASLGLDALPATLVRSSGYLAHPVFNSYHSETAMMRYLKRLADRDYALDRGMIPLGSCTMKLNAAIEMEAITWPEFANLHPFAPEDQVRGSLRIVADLERWLAAVTGYDAVTLQPNAGSQGELTGLLAIRRYHESRDDAQRTVCLIPSSAHGTNAASAVLAGLRVVVVACDENGNVDVDDLDAKIAAAGDELAALMVTYPSTHGVYEPRIAEICHHVHAAGGQVYIDGANFNALIGEAKFAEFGGDVSHLNLHKTFCIPHGGGGPGVGPVAAKAHLAPFLPGHPLAQQGGHEHPVSAAPYGSPLILPISWAYIRMMGAAGLRAATGGAVLAANYVAARLRDIFPVLYTGPGGFVAHECVLDLRPLTEATGVTVDDVAKRLVDYGFHAPTMSFPVAGTLMVEPTESEDLAELDRFVAAMRAIKAEADAVAAGRWPADDNPLVNAPHTAWSVVGGEWSHPYSRETAAYPFAVADGDGGVGGDAAADGGAAAGLSADDAMRRLDRVRSKYWPPVRRIDGVYGDRHLVCSCPAPEAFE